ncbi:hypothetical protein HZQ15_18800 [Elizabethkingia anophelis]|nr:hypothetical protein [Elizabethkingia anophelis]MCT4042848.1 hypothetical protein [Elizabethkingia anophelis]
MENKLIPLSDFVLKTVHTPNINEAICWEQTEERLQKIYKYTQFLKQPLALWMFVPCDQNGNILSEPQMIEKRLGFDETEIDYNYAEVEVYKKAKERVLFEGFEIEQSKSRIGFYLAEYNCIDYSIIKNNFSSPSKYLTTIEDLIIYSGLTLTETAKQIYGS